MKQGMNKWTKGWMNEYMKHNEWWAKQLMSVYMVEWGNALINDKLNEWVN